MCFIQQYLVLQFLVICLSLFSLPFFPLSACLKWETHLLSLIKAWFFTLCRNTYVCILSWWWWNRMQTSACPLGPQCQLTHEMSGTGLGKFFLFQEKARGVLFFFFFLFKFTSNDYFPVTKRLKNSSPLGRVSKEWAFHYTHLIIVPCFKPARSLNPYSCL